MRILSHYFVGRFVGLFSTVLVAAIILLATVELVLNLDDVSSFERGSESETASGALRYLWVRIVSYYLPDLFPIAAFAAVFIVFASAGRAMELVAIQTGGVRLGRIVIPVLLTALILSFAGAILQETVVLRADQLWSAQARSAADEIDFGRKAFWYHKGSTITNVQKADPRTRTLHGVEVFERGPDGLVTRVIRARRVRITPDGVWQIENGRIWTFDPANPADPPLLRENVSIDLDLDALGGDALLGADPSLLPLPALARHLEADTEDTGANRRRLIDRYHERLSQPWLVVLFALLALPFGLRVDQTGRLVRPALESVVVLALFFLLRSAGTTLAQEQLFPVGVTPWLSIGVFGAASVLALRRHGL